LRLLSKIENSSYWIVLELLKWSANWRKKVLEVTKLNAQNLMEQSGIEPSLTKEEISNLLAEVKKEISITKKENPEGES
jgi:hypothetical protein